MAAVATDGFGSSSSLAVSMSDIPFEEGASDTRLFEEAATCIQRASHRFVCRRHIHREVESRNLAATRIQAFARGFLVRKLGRRRLIPCPASASLSDTEEEAFLPPDGPTV
jgi:hypothetical protein